VSDFHLDIPRGSIYGLLGPNGSGKTTTIRMIMGILVPDEGSVGLLGSKPDQRNRQKVGYLPEERGVYKKMKVLEQLEFLGEIRGMPRREARKKAAGWLERLGLESWNEKKIEDLSKGMQQKVQFIGTILHDPELLILDEPFSGLDPINQDVLEQIVREFHKNGTTILFSTHLMPQAEHLCEHVCLISKARKVLDGNLKELREAEAEGVVAIEFDGDDDRWIRGQEVSSVGKDDDTYHVVLQEGADHQAILRRGVEADVSIRRFELVVPSLHQIFVRHAGAEAAGDAGVPTDFNADLDGGAR
jgi:ABC-2 type transport system ATP-binding protein